VHRNGRRIAEAIAAVEARIGADANDQEVAEELGLSLTEYHAILQDSVSCRLFSFEETYGEDNSTLEDTEVSQVFANPLNGVEQDLLKQSLARAISQLPERERLVLALYYDEELNLKEIGQIIGVSESRVSQIHSQAALRLRANLEDWRPPQS